ncbi:MAG: helix-turn-helix transcriptional regulator [Nocardioides sp.]
MADDDIAPVLDQVGPRLRELRQRRRTTLARLSEDTGISVSTLSRLESGQRKPTLELLLPLAKAHRVALDELVGAPETGDPRVHARPVRRHGMTYVPLTQQLGGLRAYKQILPGTKKAGQEVPQGTHEGYEWFYVLSGKLRLVLGGREVVMGPGEAAEFDTRVPHGFVSADENPVELLSLFGPQGERIHVRARPRA